MTIDRSALGASMRTLDDLIDRLVELAAEAPVDDEVGGEVREVERQLRTAARRLERAHRALR
ncbi:MAG: hypothetical protein ACRBI6_19865 [Acidimicrobiales bacterium]